MIGFGLGLTIYGPVAIFGVVAMETAPNNLAGTAHAVAGLFANGKKLRGMVPLLQFFQRKITVTSLALTCPLFPFRNGVYSQKNLFFQRSKYFPF